MGERNQEAAVDMDEMFEPILGDFADDGLEAISPLSTEKQRLAAKRRRAEMRLEEKRLREELGYYDFHFDDD
jgi:hypothetical protein